MNGGQPTSFTSTTTAGASLADERGTLVNVNGVWLKKMHVHPWSWTIEPALAPIPTFFVNGQSLQWITTESRGECDAAICFPHAGLALQAGGKGPGSWWMSARMSCTTASLRLRLDAEWCLWSPARLPPSHRDCYHT